jgi:hypothetical protein
MAVAWPWSVPRLPFSATVRPNSDIGEDEHVAHAVAEVTGEGGQGAWGRITVRS